MNGDFNRRADGPSSDTLSKAMSIHDLSTWGLQDVAYVKRVRINDEYGWSIHSADGENIGLSHDRDHAFAAVRQYDLEPFSVH